MAGTFFNGLDPAVADMIRDAAALRSYPARSFIFYEGDPGSGVFLIESGLLRVDRTTRDGKIALLDLAMRGDLIGELSVIDGDTRSATLSTVTDCTIRFLPRDAFKALLKESELVQNAVLYRLTRRIRSLSTQFLQTATMDAPARVAARLLRLVEIERSLDRLQIDESGVIDLKMPINQEELGQWAGLAREGAVKGLGTLRSIGAIETGRKRVWIHDLDELQRRSESG